jgi:hypothetical protein
LNESSNVFEFGVVYKEHAKNFEMIFWNDRERTGRRMYTGRPGMPAVSMGEIFQKTNGTMFEILSKSRRS